MDPKRYKESPTRSAELLRLALPLMSRQKAAPHPLSYAVWYEHVAGTNRALSEAIEALTGNGQPLDEAQTARLFDAHVLDVNQEANQRVAEDFRGLLQELSDSAQQAGDETDRYGQSLARWNRVVEDGQADDPDALHEVLAETQEMRSAVGRIKGRLDASRAEIARLRAEIERVRDEALIDSLTGLANRRAFEARIAACVDGPPQSQALIVVDIDHFKRINDTYGHLFGDQVLKVVAQAVRASLAPQQLVARIGGEEFAILLTDSAAGEARSVAQKVLTTVAGSRIRRRESNETIGQVTVSVGFAARRAGETAEGWFDRADQALYASKQGGRNRLTVAPG